MLKLLITLGVVIVLTPLFALFTMLLWDALMPDIFGLGEITYLQAWGLQLLGGLLFGKVVNCSGDSDS